MAAQRPVRRTHRFDGIALLVHLGAGGTCPPWCYGYQVHKLSHYLADQATRELDDRDLTSRSDLRKQRKQSEQAYAELARSLCDCTNKQLIRLVLQDALLEVVQQARRIESPGARDRALRLVRRELRGGNSEDVRRQLDAVLHPVSKVSQQQIEAWVSRLSAEGDPAIEEFIAAHSNADRQQLRGLVRSVAKARDAARDNALLTLFKKITQWLNEPTSTTDEESTRT
jgi:ribosome-associated protein